MKVGMGFSSGVSSSAAVAEATSAAVASLEGRPAGLALVFASPHHADRARDVLDAVHDVASPAAVVGCVSEAVVAGAREVEGEPAVSVWVSDIEGGQTFHMQFSRTESGGLFSGWLFERPEEGAVPVHLLIADPYTFPVDHLLGHLNESVPGAVVVGGMASRGFSGGDTILFQDRSIRRDGAVGVRLPPSITVRTFVSQGCRPIGDSYVVTRAEQNVLYGLAGRPPLERLRETVNAMAPPDRELISRGLHVGRVIDEYKPEHGIGDFLIRGVIGADPDSGAVAVGDTVDVGETVQFHVRDAATADEELRSLLERHSAELPGEPAGALLFTCNGRGSRMFPTPDHDAELVSKYLGGVPVAGFFCAGELGPVGGKNFLHGFTG
ncbi:MAG TPA: FIST N-terminal domain-containing protein [Actinomycetota bacterium]|nr:FIST N-terminal domain-containing protein [Actinomycetota bacterium]